MTVFRAIFRWITVKDLNVMQFDETVDQDTPLGLLRGIKVGTESYHTLFMRLCRLVLVSINTYTYTHTHARTHSHMHAHTHTYTPIHTHTHLELIHASTHTYPKALISA